VTGVLRRLSERAASVKGQVKITVRRAIMARMSTAAVSCLGCGRDLQPGSPYFADRVQFANGFACSGCADAFRPGGDDSGSGDEVDRTKAFFTGNTGGFTGGAG
jgi:hypothetical protein